MDSSVQHSPGQMRAWVEVDANTAYVEYSIHDGQLDILHTIVPKPIEGRGIASMLVGYVYDYALNNGLVPAATCVYAKAWLQRHPEYMR